MNTEERQSFWNALCKANGMDQDNDRRNISNTITYPDFLYRYRPVSVSSIDALQQNYLYYSKADYYDDPFDTLIKIDYKKIHSDISRVLSDKNVFTQFRLMCDTLNVKEEIYLNAKNAMETLSEEEITLRVDRFLKDHIQSVLKQSLWTACFTESGVNETMWLKYADQYRGFCVVYGMRDDEKWKCGKLEKCANCIINSTGFSLYPVCYSDEGYDATEYAKSLTVAIIVQEKFPTFADLIIKSLPNTLWEQERVTLIKSKCHEYDQEWRMILRNKGNGPMLQEWVPYGVILGIRTSDQNRKVILRSAETAGIPHVFETFINNDNKLDYKEIRV